ncbi:MAG: AsmA-like C-terminal region-containing protein [Chthoniobacteraceae bacterium]|jgi:hypothetical protein
MNRILPRLGIALLALIVFLLAAVMVARAMFVNYLKSDAFRRTLGESAANAMHASHADFSPLQFDGSLVYGGNFHASRDDGGGFSAIDADQLRASFDWHGLLHHTVQIDELAIQRVTVTQPAASLAGTAPPESIPGAPESPAPIAGWHQKWTADLRKAVINETNWQWSQDPPGGISGASLTLTPDTDSGWIIDAEGGTLQQAGWPALDLDTADMRWQSPTLYINSGSLRDGSGRLDVTGSVQARQSVDLDVKFDGVDVRPLLTPDWRERLSGNLSGQAHIQAQLGSDADSASGPRHNLTVSGSVVLTDGQLTALPVLDEIGVFTQTERFRRLDLTRASADFTHSPDRLEVRNMVMESEGLIRVEGNYTIVDGQMDGTFQVGLTPGTLQWIPGSQDEVFTVSHDGYLWTSMRLTGPASHPHDDLTARLAVAAGKNVIEGTEGTVKKAADSVLDLLLH